MSSDAALGKGSSGERPGEVTRAILVIGTLVLAMVASARARAQDLEGPLPPPPEVSLPEPESATPSADQRRAARLLGSLQIEEAAIDRQQSAADGERAMAVALYIGGVSLTVGAVSLLVLGGLQGACVAEADLGCYDAPDYFIAGLAAGLIGGVVIVGADFSEQRADFMERELDRRRDDLEERRRLLERQVGLALGPMSLQLRVSF